MLSNVRMDYRANNLNLRVLLVGCFTLHNFYLVFIYRVAHWLVNKRIKVLPWMLAALGKLLYAADISPRAVIGAGFQIAHSVGIVIGAYSRIGANCKVFQNVTIGLKDDDLPQNFNTMPQIGDDVKISAGAAILGPVKIGSNSIIGSNAVVLHDAPNNSVLVGIPARISV